MKINFKFLFFALIVIITIYFLRANFSEYNIKKTVSACILAKKQTSKSFDLEKVKKFCEESIRKQKEN